jgi:hypothetical protein
MTTHVKACTQAHTQQKQTSARAHQQPVYLPMVARRMMNTYSRGSFAWRPVTVTLTSTRPSGSSLEPSTSYDLSSKKPGKCCAQADMKWSNLRRACSATGV